ncbi:hypothetical protein [Hydrogenophaga sp.]|uniref:hypothetical protein n=1 Tax=Hydrogenophaga sp. TaxID=1904254 RepID=UPI00271BA879|nr:hypothetical protein [Hydrogenophaga sp.]MDO8903968.1 hypothetical protein [Hydrogenophaga sp.]
MIGDDDMEVFFDSDEFATTFHKVVDELPVEPGFQGIKSAVDEEVLQRFVAGTVEELRFITAAVQLLEDDRITDGTTTWRVLREGFLLADGAESACYITPA